MAIRVLAKENQFILTTKNTTYAFEVLKGQYLRHLYYGKKTTQIPTPDFMGVSFSPYIAQYNPLYSPDSLPCEISYFGAGDFRQTALRFAVPDGTDVTDFVYDSYRIFNGRHQPDGLPFARADEHTQTLKILLKDPLTQIELSLFYTVFADTDVITRYLQVKNKGTQAVTLKKCMPLELCLNRCDWDMISFYGHYAKEFCQQRVPLHHGTQTITSRRGASSHQANPFLALCDHKATEEKGEVYGFNLVYSGSFENAVEVDQLDTTKVLMGLGSECFSYTLQPDETFDSPEAVMTYSAKGLGGMSRNFHRFIRNHLLPKEALTPHPVVLNTWEACYFDIDANKLLSFAKEASHCGFDMLVMDDGWFGSRNGETAGLGDWQENKTKFPMGLKSFVKEICRQGVSFGIWIEPEMVNPDSDLYRAHPEWCLQIDGRESFLARNQMVLDMTNPQVISYLKESFTQTFQGVDISYFKWDMNRHLCALGSCHLPKEQQGEIAFRYMKGVYSLLSWFRETFPHAVIETCSGGGGRYDLGMMPYGIQIWLSDNTDPYARMKMQWTALTAYPAATMSCHVSNPQDNLSSLDFRYHVAVGGMLGYELNILDMNEEIKERIKEQIQEYKTFEAVIRSGDYYGLVSPLTHPYAASYYVSEDNSKILLSLAETQTCKEGKTKLLKIKRADSRKIYIDQKTGKKYAGTDLKKGITLPLTGKENASRLLILTAQQ